MIDEQISTGIDENGTIYISTSDIRRFKECRRKWDFSSLLRMGQVPAKTPIYFLRGIAWHKALEDWYNNPTVSIVARGQVAFTQLLKEYPEGTYSKEEIHEELDLIADVLELYPEYAKQNDNFQVVSTEQRNDVYLTTQDHTGNEIRFSFRTDQIVKRNNGLWIHDFKTTRDLPTDSEFLSLDEQVTGYITAVEKHLGEEIKGAIFTYLKTKSPTVPRLLKSGKLSQAKNIQTPKEVYLREIHRHGLDSKDYQTTLARLENKVSWFQRFEVIKNKKQKEIFWKNCQQVAKEMTKQDVLIYPSPARLKCSLCPYMVPCLKVNDGLELTELNNQFIQGESW